MAQLDVPSFFFKGKEVEIGEVNGEGQVKTDPPSEMWHVSINVRIYRVPKPIMTSNSQAYTPLVVSLGPYHQKINPTVSTMYQHKFEAVHRTLARLEKDVTSLLAKINELESKIRDCYEEPIDWDEGKLSWMFAMDACFILEWFKCSTSEMLESRTDSFSLVFQTIDHQNTLHQAILNDIMKLENQIPLCVLTAVLELEFGTYKQAKEELAKLLYKFILFQGFPFSFSLSGDDDESKEQWFKNLMKYMMNTQPPCHLLDLHRMVIKDLLTHSSHESVTAVECDAPRVADNRSTPDDSRRTRRRCGWRMNVALPIYGKRLSCSDILNYFWPTRSHDDSIPSAELLHKAGIKFRPGQIGFENNKLFLPQIVVEDTTETMLRNLMAYEECQRCSLSPDDTVISHFVCFLDELIESEKDVSILKEDGIIKSYLGSDKEVADMFNNLCKGISVDIGKMFAFHSAAQQVREHYYSPWKKRLRSVKEAHCSKPLYWVSILAGTAILVMTAVQMGYAIKNG